LYLEIEIVNDLPTETNPVGMLSHLKEALVIQSRHTNLLSSKSHAELGAETDWKKQPVLQTVLMSKSSISASK
jgi:hypothetical protein